jgi:hypothetical protein
MRKVGPWPDRHGNEDEWSRGSQGRVQLAVSVRAFASRATTEVQDQVAARVADDCRLVAMGRSSAVALQTAVGILDLAEFGAVASYGSATFSQYCSNQSGENQSPEHHLSYV